MSAPFPFDAWAKPGKDAFDFWISFFPTAPLFGVEWRFAEMMHPAMNPLMQAGPLPVVVPFPGMRAAGAAARPGEMATPAAADERAADPVAKAADAAAGATADAGRVAAESGKAVAQTAAQTGARSVAQTAGQAMKTAAQTAAQTGAQTGAQTAAQTVGQTAGQAAHPAGAAPEMARAAQNRAVDGAPAARTPQRAAPGAAAQGTDPERAERSAPEAPAAVPKAPQRAETTPAAAKAQQSAEMTPAESKAPQGAGKTAVDHGGDGPQNAPETAAKAVAAARDPKGAADETPKLAVLRAETKDEPHGAKAATAFEATGPAAGKPDGSAADIVEAAIAAGPKPAVLFAKRPAEVDDLKMLKGVGPGLEKQLNELGVWRLDQIAKMTDADLVWIDSNLTSFKGRCFRDDWVGQAKSRLAR